MSLRNELLILAAVSTWFAETMGVSAAQHQLMSMKSPSDTQQALNGVNQVVDHTQRVTCGNRRQPTDPTLLSDQAGPRLADGLD
jgi:hypothetical protein